MRLLAYALLIAGPVASFAFTLAEPLAAPGDYSIADRYAVTNPDGSLSAPTDQANLAIK